MKRWIALYYDIVDVNKFVVADDDLDYFWRNMVKEVMVVEHCYIHMVMQDMLQ